MFKNKTKNIKEARDFAIKWHGDQMYGPHPYLYHLDMVANIAKDAGLDEKYIIACYLHDVIEDTQCTFKLLRECFGEDIESMVYLVTDELGRNRKERKGKTYKKLKGEISGTIIKLCDRIANIVFSSENSKDKSLMYIKEDPVFRGLKEHIFYSNNSSAYDKLWLLYNQALEKSCDNLINNW